MPRFTEKERVEVWDRRPHCSLSDAPYVHVSIRGRERENNRGISFRAVGKYDSYAKDVLRETFGERFDTTDDVVFSFGPNTRTGEVDGTIDGKVAVEIGVGSQKQVRASVLDLIFHPYPMKLLVLVDTPEHETGRSVRQAGAILAQASKPGVVVRLAGAPSHTMMNVDGTKLADIVNRYIGETEKNLVRVFDAVEGTGSVLLFDKADGLFGPQD